MGFYLEGSGETIDYDFATNQGPNWGPYLHIGVLAEGLFGLQILQVPVRVLEHVCLSLLLSALTVN
jgi:hypothetical protein